MSNRSIGFAFAASLVMATALHAATTATTLVVSAEVPSDCRIAISDLAFGKYDPLGGNASRELDAAGAVTMLCTRNSRATIYFDAGLNANSSSRTLTGGTQHVAYQLYRDPGRTREWRGGDGLQFVSGGIHKAEELTLYGRIPPGQEVASGVYTDVVTATVDF